MGISENGSAILLKARYCSPDTKQETPKNALAMPSTARCGHTGLYSVEFVASDDHSRSARTSVVIDHPSRYEAMHMPGNAVLTGRTAISLQ
jgi:hypothetical protein